MKNILMSTKWKWIALIVILIIHRIRYESTFLSRFKGNKTIFQNKRLIKLKQVSIYRKEIKATQRHIVCRVKVLFEQSKFLSLHFCVGGISFEFEIVWGSLFGFLLAIDVVVQLDMTLSSWGTISQQLILLLLFR